MVIPSFVAAVVGEFFPAFTKPSYHRFLVLLLGAVLTTGRRTISNILRTVGHKASGHPSSYHYFFSERVWKCLDLGRILISLVLKHLVPEGPVYIAMDDTVAEHPGKKVWGKGKHRDGVRSTHTYTAFRWGHKWVVISIVVKLPFSTRPWALPVLIALYRAKDWDLKHNTHHRTPAEVALTLLKILTRWFPVRKFIAIGDSGFGSSAMARTISRVKNLELVSRFYSDASLYETPAPRKPKENGRPRKKGKKLASPEESVRKAKNRKRLKVKWYGGEDRDVEIVSGNGYWYRIGKEMVKVYWVYVHDLTGTHRDEYFYTTDSTMTSKQIIECYTMRWSIETTFQETREYLRIESTKCHVKQSVLRMTPCLFCLYTLIILMYLQLSDRSRRQKLINWQGKTQTTFSDMITIVRRELWKKWVFQIHKGGKGLSKPSKKIWEMIMSSLAPAA